MNILALHPFHGGSHRAFLEGWAHHSRHEFTVLPLPAHKWKWRMRHAAVTFAQEVRQFAEAGQAWDALFTTDMLNLAEFRGLAPPAITRLPGVVYFHENQLTYPDRSAGERDLHFAFTNLTTALAASRVWFNSAYHRDDFLSACGDLLRRMPDCQPFDAVETVRMKAEVHPPGIDTDFFAEPATRSPGPLRIVWVSRWEHDKDPDTFFRALEILADRGRDFRVSVLGESFRDAPACFDAARRRFATRIDHWGFAEDRDDYRRILQHGDVVVSTARHEFFGMGVVEAVAAGCLPLVPGRLAYPEVLGDDAGIFHDGTPDHLARRLAACAERLAEGALWNDVSRTAQELTGRFRWDRVSAEMDAAMETLSEHEAVPKIGAGRVSETNFSTHRTHQARDDR